MGDGLQFIAGVLLIFGAIFTLGTHQEVLSLFIAFAAVLTLWDVLRRVQ